MKKIIIEFMGLNNTFEAMILENQKKKCCNNLSEVNALLL